MDSSIRTEIERNVNSWRLYQLEYIIGNCKLPSSLWNILEYVYNKYTDYVSQCHIFTYVAL